MIPWMRSLQASIKTNSAIEFSRYIQFATVTPDGFPACRTVVFRGFTDQQEIIITTDARSSKIQDLKNLPKAELCWYFPLSKEQFRIFGNVRVLEDVSSVSGELKAEPLAEASDALSPAPSPSPSTEDQTRSRVWRSMSDSIRLTFDSPPPGRPKPSHQQLSDLDRYEPQPMSAEVPSPHFVVLLVQPIKCDHLTLPSYQRDIRKPIHAESLLQPARQMIRWLHTLQENGSWQTVELNP
eukprot:TRINITY_DN1900_c0_g1_i1.p1 TRINITY_DN1900_c0_g1~~TRINITY_DN1900_c0_g1_i1.p1  ORF type:complete len:239 (-),score=35.98 TRINITY_DN1900_c0_g1_i1:74-790(-)